MVIVTAGNDIGLYFAEGYSNASYVKEISDPSNIFSASIENKAVKIAAVSGTIGTHLRFRLNDL